MRRRKTRQEKIIADLRRKVGEDSSLSRQQNNQEKHMYSLPKSHLTLGQSTPQYISVQTLNASILMHDLRKTMLLTMVIISGEILFFFLIKNHIIAIPMIGY